MKALKDYKWIVLITLSPNRGYAWAAISRSIDVELYQGLKLATHRHAENHWKRFAKVNDIKSWEYV